MSALSYMNPPTYFSGLCSDGLKEGNRIKGKMSFVTLICKTWGFMQMPVKASQWSKNFPAPAMRSYGLERRRNGAKTETQEVPVFTSVHACGGGPGDLVPSLMAGGVQQRWHLHLKWEHSLPHQQLLPDSLCSPWWSELQQHRYLYELWYRNNAVCFTGAPVTFIQDMCVTVMFRACLTSAFLLPGAMQHISGVAKVMVAPTKHLKHSYQSESTG